jgi:hypothetical protein
MLVGARIVCQGRRLESPRHVEQHEDGLLGQEPVPAERLLLVGIERLVADRPAGLECGLEPRQDRLLAVVRLALGRCRGA